MLRKPDAVINIKGIFILSTRNSKSLDVHDVAGGGSSSISPCNERTDRGDEQVTCNFIIEKWKYAEQKLENIGISAIDL